MKSWLKNLVEPKYRDNPKLGQAVAALNSVKDQRATLLDLYKYVNYFEVPILEVYDELFAYAKTKFKQDFDVKGLLGCLGTNVYKYNDFKRWYRGPFFWRVINGNFTAMFDCYIEDKLRDYTTPAVYNMVLEDILTKHRQDETALDNVIRIATANEALPRYTPPIPKPPDYAGGHRRRGRRTKTKKKSAATRRRRKSKVVSIRRRTSKRRRVRKL